MAVAVSGGPDSLALTLLAHAWAVARGGRVLGLIVDHGLRPESAKEAALVRRWLDNRDIAVRVLAWHGPKPATGLQAAAREARYQLLLDSCRAESILHLLLAHHAEDQAETVAMRAERRSGAAGLAGMPAVVETGGVRLLRPLLSVPKHRLRATLQAVSQPWLTDPSNASPRFRRGQLRRDSGFVWQPWWKQGREHAQTRTALDRELARFLACHARPHRFGFVRLAFHAWLALPVELRLAALIRLLVSIGGSTYPPHTDSLRQLDATLAGAPGRTRSTLGGCLIAKVDKDLVIAREPARITHRETLLPGASCLWDRRFHVACEHGAGPLTLGPLGEAGRQALSAAVRERLRAARVPPAAVAALPALYRDQQCLCPPLEPYGLVGPRDVVLTAVLHVGTPLAAAPFGGVNVVSNDERLIYRSGTGGEAAA